MCFGVELVVYGFLEHVLELFLSGNFHQFHIFCSVRFVRGPSGRESDSGQVERGISEISSGKWDVFRPK